MALDIYWSRRADAKFDKIIEYLLENWGERATKDFVQKVYMVLDILCVYPEMGPLQHTEKNIRGFVIVKQVTLFYKVQDDTLILLNFFGNFQNPKKKFI
ncbi:MAG TPA: type II toxin-antitoxin system RelE/ParE family toxin [Flavobacterium sp.]|nr:type II toxin-antitoxin system RelE/ParE family toxin [Flavobacterium sp.]